MGNWNIGVEMDVGGVRDIRIMDMANGSEGMGTPGEDCSEMEESMILQTHRITLLACEIHESAYRSSKVPSKERQQDQSKSMLSYRTLAINGPIP
jgi:hypothetical protein